METLDSNSGGELKVTDTSVRMLLEAGKWAKFLSIVGFVMIGLLVVAALFMIVAGSSMPLGLGRSGAIVGVAYLLSAVLYFFPTYFLFQFAVKIKSGFGTNSQSEMDLALTNLKSMFKFVGILTIVVLAIYLLVFLFAFIAVAAA